MIIKGVDNQEIDFKVTNYQFPNITDDEWDRNWLNIYIKVISKFGNWQTIDPSLTTWEVQQIVEWLDDLANDVTPEWLDQEFTEPNLTLKLLNKVTDPIKIIRMSFDHESKPQSASDYKEVFIDIEADKTELKRMSNDLRIELSKYPTR